MIPKGWERYSSEDYLPPLDASAVGKVAIMKWPETSDDEKSKWGERKVVIVRVLSKDKAEVSYREAHMEVSRFYLRNPDKKNRSGPRG